MSTYRAPMQEIQFVMNELAGLEQVGKLPGYEDATPDTVAAILDEAAKFATEVLDPLNAVGDREGATWNADGSVKTPTGFKDAYRRFAENGWNGLTKNPEHGGQGLAQLVANAGEQDYTDNIIHLVLGRTPTAPEGVKGISLFVVPKYLVNDDGTLSERNDVFCVSIEHKLGIHASPTAVLAYGDRGGAVGYLVGEENRGLEYMFIMMNLARFSVGIEGVGIAERSYQRAREYARDRG